VVRAVPAGRVAVLVAAGGRVGGGGPGKTGKGLDLLGGGDRIGDQVVVAKIDDRAGVPGARGRIAVEGVGEQGEAARALPTDSTRRANMG